MIEIPIRVNLSVSESQQQFNLIANESAQQYNLLVDSQIIANSYDIYDGIYDAIPKTVEQKLYTKDRYMTDDVTIHKIPYYEVSNLNGMTVYIGNNIND